MTTQEFNAILQSLQPEDVTLLDGNIIIQFFSGDQVLISSPPLIEFIDEDGTVETIQDTSL